MGNAYGFTFVVRNDLRMPPGEDEDRYEDTYEIHLKVGRLAEEVMPDSEVRHLVKRTLENQISEAV